MSDNNIGENSKQNDEDTELNELLDSALEDLTKQPVIKEQKNDTSNSENELEQLNTDQSNIFDEQWTDEIKKLAANYETTMEALMSQFTGGEGVSPPSVDDVNTSMQKLAEAASEVFLKGEQSDDVTSTIAQTLKNLAQGAETAQQNDFNDEQLTQMLSQMGLGNDTTGAGGDSTGFMLQGMMQALLSKELLYPSLKLITDKYPDWLDENRSKLDTEQLERYTKQCELMKHVCDELEKENDTDSIDIKKDRTNKILGLMQQLEFLGQPPSDLVGVPVDNAAFNPQAGCSLM